MKKNMKKSVKNIIKYNFKTLIGFEILYKLLSSIIFVPLFLEIFKLITKISGYSYLTLENIINFTQYPNYNVIALNTKDRVKDSRITYNENLKATSQCELYNKAAQIIDSEYILFINP